MESHVINADLDISCPFVVTVILKVASSGWMKMGRASVKRVAGWMKMGRASVKRVAGWMKMGRASVKRVAGWMKMGRASVSKITRGMSHKHIGISYASAITFIYEPRRQPLPPIMTVIFLNVFYFHTCSSTYMS